MFHSLYPGWILCFPSPAITQYEAGLGRSVSSLMHLAKSLLHRCWYLLCILARFWKWSDTRRSLMTDIIRSANHTCFTRNEFHLIYVMISWTTYFDKVMIDVVSSLQWSLTQITTLFTPVSSLDLMLIYNAWKICDKFSWYVPTLFSLIVVYNTWEDVI